MVEIYNLDNCELSIKNGFYGGAAGNKDGILWNNEMWLVKYPKNIKDMQRTGGASYSTAPLSEFIGSQIYKILGYDVHETALAERDSKTVVACKDFAVNGDMLFELRTLKNHANKKMTELFERDFENTGSKHFVDLEVLLLHLYHNPILSKIEGIRERFWEQAVVDIFINNSDRNNGNWGIVRDKDGKDRIAPVFDNGGCFQTHISEEKISRLLQDKVLCEKNASNTQTTYALGGHILSSKKFLGLIQECEELRKAVLNVVPNIFQNYAAVAELIDNIPEKHTLINGETVDVCSHTRKELYLLQMRSRFNDLLRPCYYEAAKLEKIEDIFPVPAIEDGIYGDTQNETR